MRIQTWKNADRELKALAEKGKMSLSLPNQIASGDLGVGAKTAPAWARALDFPSADALQAAAGEWWAQQRAQAEGPAPEAQLSPAQMAAIDVVATDGAATREQLRTFLSAYRHPRFATRSKNWWIQRLFDEVEQDRLANAPVPAPERTATKRPPARPPLVGEKTMEEDASTITDNPPPSEPRPARRA